MDVMVQAPIVSRYIPYTSLISKFELLTKKKLEYLLGTSASCSTAFTSPDQTFKQVACQVDNVCALFPKQKKGARYLTIDHLLGRLGYYLLWLIVTGYLESSNLILSSSEYWKTLDLGLKCLYINFDTYSRSFPGMWLLRQDNYYSPGSGLIFVQGFVLCVHKACSW